MNKNFFTIVLFITLIIWICGLLIIFKYIDIHDLWNVFGLIVLFKILRIIENFFIEMQKSRKEI